MPKGKNRHEIGLMRDELCGKTIKKLVRLKAKTYSCLIDDDSEDHKAESTKKFQKKKTWKENLKIKKTV